MIIDTHAHLDHLEDANSALDRAFKEDVSDIIAVSIGLEACQKNIKLYDHSNPNVHVAMGIHPSEVQKEDVDEVFSLIDISREKLVAVGEVGLDYTYKWAVKDEDNKVLQRKVFARFVSYAKEYDMPLIVHSRGAEQDCLNIVEEIGHKQVLFHWYSGPVDVMQSILDAGFYVSTSPAIGYSGFSRKAISKAPLDRILIETDTPVGYRNNDQYFQSEPKDVWQTLKGLAELKSIDQESLLKIVNQNARNFFRL